MPEVNLNEIDKPWDAVIIGAGPAGAMTAFKLASLKKNVLLVDKATFPRRKVCGCCLNGYALTCLAEEGLGDLTKSLNAVPLHELLLFTEGSNAELKLPGAQSVSREALDEALVNKAVDAGAFFLSDASATVGEVDTTTRAVTIKCKIGTAEVRGRVVIAADGIAGRALDHLPEFSPIISAKSRIGAGAVMHDPSEFYKPGKIYMACGSGGYVGVVRLEDNRLDVAAAFDLTFSRASGGPANAATRIFDEVGMPRLKEMLQANWHGTAPLTRHRPKIAGERLFVIGDSASYAEPFTGEGIGWALLSARAISNLSVFGMSGWRDSLVDEWTTAYARLIGKRQSISTQIAAILRLGMITKVSAKLLNSLPSLASPVIRHINTPDEI